MSKVIAIKGDTKIKKIVRGDLFYDITKIRGISPAIAAEYEQNPQHRARWDASNESIADREREGNKQFKQERKVHII